MLTPGPASSVHIVSESRQGRRDRKSLDKPWSTNTCTRPSHAPTLQIARLHLRRALSTYYTRLKARYQWKLVLLSLLIARLLSLACTKISLPASARWGGFGIAAIYGPCSPASISTASHRRHHLCTPQKIHDKGPQPRVSASDYGGHLFPFFVPDIDVASKSLASRFICHSPLGGPHRGKGQKLLPIYGLQSGVCIVVIMP